VVDGPAECDDGGEPLLGCYRPADLDGLPPQPPEIRIFYRTFVNVWNDEGSYDVGAELEETLRHELEHHLAHLAGTDPVDDQERAEIDAEVARRIGRTEAKRRAISAAGRDLRGFFASTWALWALLLAATLIAFLSNPKNPGHARSRNDAELGAQASGLSFHSATAQSASELDNAIANAAKAGSSALFILTDALFNSHVSQIAQAALKQRLPAVYDRADFVEEGGLASYGVNLPDLSRRAAEYVDQIFKGKKPGELTLVQPTKFDLALNLKTAKQIGVAIPPDVLAKAAKVIR